MSVGQPFNVYREQLSSLYQGLALWNPKPVKNLHKQPDHVSIGDVGYLDNGAFIRIFNVTLPWDDPLNKLLGEPEEYERINPGDFSDVRDDEIREGEYYTAHVSKVDNIGANTHQDSIGQLYECGAQHRGAYLFLPHKGHRKDALRINVFKEYIRDNVDNWFRWTKKMKLSVDQMEDLILVTGCTLVTSWAIAAFDNHMSVDSEEATTISLEARTSDDGGAQFFWRNIRGPVEYHNSRFDPNVQEPPPLNQCIFIRGFRAKRIFFRTIPIRAAAEPLPDDPDDRHEDETQVTRIPDGSKYRDPLVGILDYITQKCNEDISATEDIVAIAHDDDLRLIEVKGAMTADLIEKFLVETRMPLLVKNGAAIITHDPVDSNGPQAHSGRPFTHTFGEPSSLQAYPYSYYPTADSLQPQSSGRPQSSRSPNAGHISFPDGPPPPYQNATHFNVATPHHHERRSSHGSTTRLSSGQPLYSTGAVLESSGFYPPQPQRVHLSHGGGYYAAASVQPQDLDAGLYRRPASGAGPMCRFPDCNLAVTFDTRISEFREWCSESHMRAALLSHLEMPCISCQAYPRRIGHRHCSETCRSGRG